MFLFLIELNSQLSFIGIQRFWTVSVFSKDSKFLPNLVSIPKCKARKNITCLKARLHNSLLGCKVTPEPSRWYSAFVQLANDYRATLDRRWSRHERPLHLRRTTDSSFPEPKESVATHPARAVTTTTSPSACQCSRCRSRKATSRPSGVRRSHATCRPCSPPRRRAGPGRG